MNKPFSDGNCGLYLLDFGTILSLLPKPPAKLLDLGVGAGWTSIFYAKHGYDVTGQDIAEDMISLANLNKKRNSIENVRFMTCDYEQTSFNGEFDCAVFYDSLHHAVDEEKAIQAAYAALKPGGVCITAEPGVGHAGSPQSQQAMKTYGVTEKDMPPRLIIKNGKKAGFTQFKIYSRPVAPTIIGPGFRIEEIKYLFKRVVKSLSGKNMLEGNIVVMIK